MNKETALTILDLKEEPEDGLLLKLFYEILIKGEPQENEIELSGRYDYKTTKIKV